MLEYWIETASPAPTWSTLVEALESNVINRQGIASKIRSQYNIERLESVSSIGMLSMYRVVLFLDTNKDSKTPS